MMTRSSWAGIAAALTVLFSETPKADPLQRLDAAMNRLNYSLESYSRMPVLLSGDAESINHFLLSILQRNPSIQTVSRINADGETVNHVDSIGVDLVSRSMKKERWFTSLLTAGKPYTGILREAWGDVYFFRAWPLLERDSAAARRFAGAFAVKVDLKKYLQRALKGESSPMKIFYRDTLLFSVREGTKEHFIEKTLPITSADGLTIRFPRSSVTNAHFAKAPRTVASSRLETAAAMGKRKDSMDGAGKQTFLSREQGKATSDESGKKFILGSSFFADFTLAAKYLYSSNRSLIVIIAASVAAMFAIIVILLLIVVYKPRLRRRGEKELEDLLQPAPVEVTVRSEPVETIVSQAPVEVTTIEAASTEETPVEEATAEEATSQAAPIEAILISSEELGGVEKPIEAQPVATEKAEEIHENVPAGQAIKEFPALKEVIVESCRKFHEFDPKSAPGERSRILRELQDDLYTWVSGEFKQLLGRLNQLEQAIEEQEKSHDGSVEMQELRREIGEIAEKIDLVEKRVPQKVVT